MKNYFTTYLALFSTTYSVIMIFLLMIKNQINLITTKTAKFGRKKTENKGNVILCALAFYELAMTSPARLFSEPPE